MRRKYRPDVSRIIATKSLIITISHINEVFSRNNEIVAIIKETENKNINFVQHIGIG